MEKSNQRTLDFSMKKNVQRLTSRQAGWLGAATVGSIPALVTFSLSLLFFFSFSPIFKIQEMHTVTQFYKELCMHHNVSSEQARCLLVSIGSCKNNTLGLRAVLSWNSQIKNCAMYGLLLFFFPRWINLPHTIENPFLALDRWALRPPKQGFPNTRWCTYSACMFIPSLPCVCIFTSIFITLLLVSAIALSSFLLPLLLSPFSSILTSPC